MLLLEVIYQATRELVKSKFVLYPVKGERFKSHASAIFIGKCGYVKIFRDREPNGISS